MSISDRRTSTTSSGRRTLVASLTGLAAVVCIAAPATAGAASGAPAGQKAKLQRALDRVVAAGAPGAAVLVRDGGRTTRLASGHGNLDPRTPMRVTHRTRIGGVTKSFVAAVVLQLADEGRLALGDTVARWLPNTISNGDAITIRQLLNHTSGIFSYDKDDSVFAPYMQGDLTRPYDQAAGVRLAAAHGPLFAPGTKLNYSNTNYVLLDMIVKAATGNTIAAELQARVLGPLGLRQTSYPDSSLIAGAHTHGYMPGDKPFDITLLTPVAARRVRRHRLVRRRRRDVLPRAADRPPAVARGPRRHAACRPCRHRWDRRCRPPRRRLGPRPAAREVPVRRRVGSRLRDARATWPLPGAARPARARWSSS